MRKKNRKIPKIIEAWSGPGKKEGNITKYESKFDALHIDMNQRGNTGSNILPIVLILIL